MSPAIGAARSRAHLAGRGALGAYALVAAVCAGYTAGAATGWGTPATATVMGGFGLGAAALCAGVSCLRYVCRPTGTSRAAWLLFAIASLMAAAGNAVQGWYEAVLGEPLPLVFPADVLFLLFAPAAAAGALLLARCPRTLLGRLCLILDAWLLAGSLLTVGWSLALAGTAGGAPKSPPHHGLPLVYQLLYTALAGVVLALLIRPPAGNRAAVYTALAALFLTVVCDVLAAFRNGYRPGQFLDSVRFTGSVLMACAPWAGARRQRGEGTRGEQGTPAAGGGSPHREAKAGRETASGSCPGGVVPALVPYLAAAVCILGIWYGALNGREPGRAVLYTGGLVVLALVARQAVMLLDNASLTRELARQESHFRSLVQGSSDVIMIAAIPSGVLTYVSPASQGVYGRAAEDLIGTELADLVHPDDRGPVLRKIRRFLAAPPEQEPVTRIECRIRSGSGAWLNVESTVNRYRDGLIFNSRDVTERVRLQAQLQHSASHDPLTDLPNRALFTERVRQAATGRRTDDGLAAVFFIDLDGFKSVNDTIGHQAGDELLVHIARRLQKAVRAGDTVARFGGDEFAALVKGVSTDPVVCEAQAREVAHRLRTAVARPCRVGGAEVRVAASIGIAFAEPGTSPDELIRNADLAMYRAKAAGKGRIEMHAPRTEAGRRRAEPARPEVLHPAAVHPGRPPGAPIRPRPPEPRLPQLSLLYRPVVDLSSGEISAVDAAPRRPACSAQITRLVVEHAVRRAAERHRTGRSTPVAVPLPASRLLGREPDPGGIRSALTEHNLPPGQLIVMLTGCGRAEGPEQLERLGRELSALQRLGVRVALDTFGTGHGPMDALRRLPVGIVRIDPRFIRGLTGSHATRKVTAGMLAIAADLGMDAIADGVDGPDQAELLRSMGCTHAQGLLFSAPLDEPGLSRVLARGFLPVRPPGPPQRPPDTPRRHQPNAETSVPPT